MKNLLKLITFVMMVITTNTFAQVTSGANVNATASAVILVPMTLTQDTALNFGSIIKPAAVGGTVKLTTSSERIFDGVGGSSVVQHSNGIFSVGGTANTTYELTLPSNIVVTGPLSDTMSIDNLLVKFENGQEIEMSGQTSTTNTLNSNGTDNIIIGGTLNIGVDNIGGTYTGQYEISVNYN